MMRSLPTRFARSAVAVIALSLLASCASNVSAPVENRSRQLNAPAGDHVTTPTGAGYYTVQKGDTLYSIALRYSQDYREIAAWNQLSDASMISVGQTLRVQPPDAPTPGGVSTAPVQAGTVSERPLDAAATDIGVKHEPRVNKEPYSDAAYARAQNPAASEQPTATTTTTPTPTPAATPNASVSVAGLTWGWPAKGKTVGDFATTKGLDIAGQAGDPVLAAADGRVVYAGSGLRGYGQLIIIKHNDTYLTAYAHNRKILVKEGQAIKRGVQIAEMGNTDSESVKLHFEVRKQGKPVEPLDFLPKS